MNEIRIESLLNKKKGDLLTEDEKIEVNKLKDFCYSLLNNTATEFNPDYCYAYARLAKLKIIKEKKSVVDEVFAFVAFNTLVDESAQICYDQYPLAFEFLDKDIEHLTASDLRDIAYVYYELKDYKKYFKFIELGSKAFPKGMIGGFQLVDTLINIDSCVLDLGRCYMDGIGTKKDYVKAFELFMRYHTDHLCQKYGADELNCDGALERLFNLMNIDIKKGKQYPGLYYSLAKMYREGIGTNYNYDKFLECIQMEACLFEENKESACSYLDEPINTYFDDKPRHIKEVLYKDYSNIETGSFVEFGKYNNRSIIWKVLKVENDKALLLSNDILESNYIAKRDGDDFSNYADSYLKQFIDRIDYKAYIMDIDTNRIIENDDGFLFLLSKEEVEKYIPKYERVCFARYQATINGYDHCGVEVDYFSPWFTSTDAGNGALVYVNSNGEFDKANMAVENIGIRPAMWLKLN